MMFLPPAQEYTTPVPDPDLEHLLYAICGSWAPSYYIEWLLRIDPGHTHTFAMDFESTLASFLGKPDKAEL